MQREHLKRLGALFARPPKAEAWSTLRIEEKRKEFRFAACLWLAVVSVGRVYAARVECCCWTVVEYWRERSDTCWRVSVPVKAGTRSSNPVDRYEPVDRSYLYTG